MKTTSGQRYDLDVDPRYLKMAIDAMIQHDPVKAAIELIQNSDDSYSRLESVGVDVTGQIRLDVVERRTESSWLACTDMAEGFIADELRAKVGTIGKRTSGLSEGARVTGALGRGLKEAMLGFDRGGYLHSIRDGKMVAAHLFWQEEPLQALFEPFRPQMSITAFRQQFGIPVNGSVIDVEMKPGGRHLPQHQNLATILRGHFRLRRILTNSDREVVLSRRRKLHGARVQEDIILPRYMYPVEDESFREIITSGSVPGYPQASYNLRIRRASEPLTQFEAGAQRTGGILVTSRGAVLDIGFFHLESHPGTKHIFGELSCDYLYELLRGDEPVIDLTRDGLAFTHPFVAALLSELEGVLTPILVDEARKLQAESIDLSATLKRDSFDKALRDLNEIAEEELGDDMPTVPGEQTDLNEFSFSSNRYEIAPGSARRARVYVPNSLIVEAGGVLRIVSDDDRLLVAPAEERISQSNDASGATVVVELLADEAEFATQVTAFYGDLQCNTEVVVKFALSTPISPLSFEHSSYRLRPNKLRDLLLIADRKFFNVGDEILVELGGVAATSYQLASDSVLLEAVPGDERLLQGSVSVFALQVGAHAELVARFGEFEASAALSCAEVTPPPPPEPPGGEKSLIHDIKFDPEENPPTQTSFQNGIVKVYTEHPLVRHYIGRRGERAKTREGSMLLKVLVQEALLEELVKIKDQNGKVVAIRGDKLTAINYQVDELRKRHGLRIHRAVDRMFADSATTPVPEDQLVSSN